MPDTAAFTLIELSIVLVIIGLIVGGVLVGQDLIAAATLRAQITQIERFNTAVNTFRAKYDNNLPGDMPAANAVSSGLSPSVASRTWSGISYGNGDGILENPAAANPGPPNGFEFYLFWQDLLNAGLITDSLMSITNQGGSAIPCQLSGAFCAVPAKIGQGNGMYAYSGGVQSGGNTWTSNNTNYWGLSVPVAYLGGGWVSSNPGLTVSQAYAIDTKIDDGYPQSGNVTAAYLNVANPNGYGSDYGTPVWVNPGGGAVVYYGPTTAATQGTSTTCYDNGNTLNATQQYSMSQSNGTGINCALSFKFQ